jgi:NAD(P)-dependent dehydrogenase (short-subunit alcohol dehydrogenase family)
LEDTVALVQEKVDSRDKCIIQAFSCDVTSASSVQEAVDKAVQSFGTPHLLWNNAGYQGQIKPTLEYSIDDFATVMNINVTGMFIVLQTVAKYMAAAATTSATTTTTTSLQQTPSLNFSIVNTASVAALRGTPAMVAYAASKAAVLAMTVSTAKGVYSF